MNVIAITVFNKPDLLYLYLEQLKKSGELHNYKVRLHADYGYDPEERVVMEDFQNKNPDVDIQMIVKPETDYPLAGFYNIIDSYVRSVEEADEFVIIGEEDILPTEDYLRFNRECYERFLSKYDKIFCVAHKRRPEAELDGDPEVLIGDYQLTSPSCITVDAIKKYIIPHTQAEYYYENPVLYNHINFFNCRIRPEQHTHHDGALERIMLENGMFALKPDQARSMHVGLSGIFCKGKAPEGTLEERVEQWRELIKDGDKLRSLSNLPEDLVVTDPKGPKWKNLKLDLSRKLAKASSWWYDEYNDFKEYIGEVNE